MPDHPFVEWLGDREKAVNVRVDNPVPRSVGSGGEVVSLVYRRVIHQDIDPAPFFNEFASYFLELNAVGYGYLE